MESFTGNIHHHVIRILKVHMLGYLDKISINSNSLGVEVFFSGSYTIVTQSYLKFKNDKILKKLLSRVL